MSDRDPFIRQGKALSSMRRAMLNSWRRRLGFPLLPQLAGLGDLYRRQLGFPAEIDDWWLPQPNAGRQLLLEAGE